MRTLEDNKKQKKPEKSPAGKPHHKQNIRKTVKTSFLEEYRYSVEVLPHSEALSATSLLLQYVQSLQQEPQLSKMLSTRLVVVGSKAVQRQVLTETGKCIVLVFFDPK